MSNLAPLPQSILNGLSRFIKCIVVIQFDVDVGPDLKIIRPAIQFSESDFRLICFSSLPERTSDTLTNQPNQFHSFSFVSNSDKHELLHGYCIFNQLRDPSRNRGYLQESTVVISHLNNPNLFSQLLLKVVSYGSYVQASLDAKIPIIDSALSSISQWSDSFATSTSEKHREDLAFMGDVLRQQRLLCPYSISTPWSQFLSRMTDPAELYMVFECLMLNKPLIVYASSPHFCSTFIQSALSLISPTLEYQNPVREYVTVHSFSESLMESEGGGALIGLANPFLIQHFDKNKQLPFVMILGDSLSLGDEKLLAHVKASNKSLLKDRLLNPDLKALANIAAISDHTQQDHALRFHFSNLVSRLLSPLTLYLDNSVNSGFQYAKFNKDVQSSEWSPMNTKLFTNLSQSVIHKLSLRNMGDTILTVGGTLGSFVGVSGSPSGESPPPSAALTSPSSPLSPANITSFLGSTLESSKDRSCKQVFYKEFIFTPIFQNWVARSV